MRKNILVAVMMVFALGVTVHANSTFSDVTGHWGKDAIHSMVENKISDSRDTEGARSTLH